MHVSFTRQVVYALALGLAAGLAQVAGAQERPAKTPLSKEIYAVFRKGGAAAAEKRYREIAERHRDAFEFDMKGMVDVGTEYARAGDMVSAQVFFGIANEMGTAEMHRLGIGQKVAAMSDGAGRADNRQRASAARSAPTSSRATPADLGPARNALARFGGVYGDPTQQRSPRNVFVTETCDGRLQFGAMWGDVAPWVMRSTGDAMFVQARLSSFETEPLRLEFHLSAGGKAKAVTHTLTSGHEPLRVTRLGDLPDGWRKDCRQGIR